MLNSRPRPYAALVRILPGMARTARAAPDAVGLNSTPRDCVREPTVIAMHCP